MSNPSSRDLIDKRRERLKRLEEGALPAEAYQRAVLTKKVARAAMEGDDHPLPEPYRRRNGTHERDVQRACREVLRRQGIWNRRIDGTGKVIGSGENMTMVAGELRGMPDLLACIKGQLVAIEVKAPGGKISAIQYGTLKGIYEAGGVALIACDAAKLATWLKTGQATATMRGWLPVL